MTRGLIYCRGYFCTLEWLIIFLSEREGKKSWNNERSLQIFCAHLGYELSQPMTYRELFFKNTALNEMDRKIDFLWIKKMKLFFDGIEKE